MVRSVHLSLSHTLARTHDRANNRHFAVSAALSSMHHQSGQKVYFFLFSSLLYSFTFLSFFVSFLSNFFASFSHSSGLHANQRLGGLPRKEKKFTRLVFPGLSIPCPRWPPPQMHVLASYDYCTPFSGSIPGTFEGTRACMWWCSCLRDSLIVCGWKGERKGGDDRDRGGGEGLSNNTSWIKFPNSIICSMEFDALDNIEWSAPWCKSTDCRSLLVAKTSIVFSWSTRWGLWHDDGN